MTPRRVVVTGMGLVSPLGSTLEAATAALRSGVSGVRRMPEWDGIEGLHTRVAAPVDEDLEADAIPRQFRRTMGRQAVFAAKAAIDAVADAALDGAVVKSGSTGVAIGSTVGSPGSLYQFFAHLIERRSLVGLKSTLFPQAMGHTCAANVALMLGVTGRVLAPASACASGSQGVGAGFEAIRYGAHSVMICGGADEAHMSAAATFDVAGGTSCAFNDAPSGTPRPFDAARDGLVVGEGSGIVVLEELAHAKARGARIYAEILSYSTNCDGSHITQPQQAGIEACLRRALAEAALEPREIEYINAHATGTPLGDAIEARAMVALFGDRPRVSSTKGQTGHTLGACGALETIFTILMLRHGFLAGTRNLEAIDPQCGGLHHLAQSVDVRVRVAMNNNFAFGGVNTSIVLRGFEG